MQSVGVPIIDDVLDEAVGRRHRPDPVIGATSGAAGNAELTAWTGLVLLMLIAVELVTLLDVRGLLSWHVVVGVLLTIVFAVVVGVHTLGRLVPAVTLGTGRSRGEDGAGPLRGWGPRLAIVTATLVAGALAAALILPAASGWRSERDVPGFAPGEDHHHDRPGS